MDTSRSPSATAGDSRHSAESIFPYADRPARSYAAWW